MAKWLVVGCLILGAAAGGFYVGRPEVVNAWFGNGAPRVAQDLVTVGYVDLDRGAGKSMQEAVASFERAIAVAPEYADAHAGLAEALMGNALLAAPEARDSMLSRALGAAREAHRLDPNGSASNRALAEYHRQKGELEIMLSHVNAARAVSGDSARLSVVLASAAETEERAVRHFDTALEREPNLQAARYGLALVYKKRDQKGKARALLKTLLMRVPDHERAIALLASLDDPTAVIKPEPEAKDQKPEPEGINKIYNRAERFRRADQPRKALALYDQVLEKEPGDIDALVGLGWCRIDLEEPSVAVTLFKTVLARAPDLAEAHMGMAEAYTMKGMKRDAVRYYRSYLELAPAGTEADVARRMIKSMQ